MAEADDELDIRRELDTRDSLASMAHYHASSPSAITAQVLPPSNTIMHHRRVPLPRKCCRQASFPLRPGVFAP